MATTKVGIAPMKAAQVPKPGGDFEIVEREIPNPVAGEVRIKVQACGVCHLSLIHIFSGERSAGCEWKYARPMRAVVGRMVKHRGRAASPNFGALG